MKEFRDGFTTKSRLDEDENGYYKFNNEIEITTGKCKIVMTIDGNADIFENIYMNKKEAQKLISLLKEAIKKSKTD